MARDGSKGRQKFRPFAEELRREYRYATCRRGDVLWVFHDRRRRRWFLQGQVE